MNVSFDDTRAALNPDASCKLAFRSTDVSRYPSDSDLRGYDRAQSFAKMIARAIAARAR